MPQVEITVGGRSFEVACQPGEEAFLRSAAEMLDTEASALSTQIGRMPEARMLLMAGLMLADKTAGLEDRLGEAQARIEELSAGQRPVEVPVEVRVEVPVLPPQVLDLLREVAEDAEALAQTLEMTG